IGLVFLSIAAVGYFFGSQQQFVRVLAVLQGRFDVAGVGIVRYRFFIIVVCGALALALQWAVTTTRFGSRLRAAVDDQPVASALGIDVDKVFLSTFAIGSGLAG